MKKIFIIILSCALILGLIGCGNTTTQEKDAEVKPGQEEQVEKEESEKTEGVEGTENDDIALRNTWYDEMDWDSLEQKENVELTIFGTLNYPYNIFDIKNEINEFTAYHCYEEGKFTSVRVNDLDTFLNTNKFCQQTFSSASPTAHIDLKDGTYLELMITSEPKEDEMVVNVADAIQKREYFYYSQYDPDKLLDIDMSDCENYKKGEIGAFLDRVIEKFGKPTEINLAVNNEIIENNYSLNQKYYNLVWEMEQYVISLLVTENMGSYGDTEDDIRYDADASAFLYTKIAWEQYQEHEAQ